MSEEQFLVLVLTSLFNSPLVTYRGDALVKGMCVFLREDRQYTYKFYI